MKRRAPTVGSVADLPDWVRSFDPAAWVDPAADDPAVVADLSPIFGPARVRQVLAQSRWSSARWKWLRKAGIDQRKFAQIADGRQ